MTCEELLNLYSSGVRDFKFANLAGASLVGANLDNANLDNASLAGASLAGAKGLAVFRILSAGILRVWKNTRGGVVELEIPANVPRVNGYGARKCRAASANVISAPAAAVSFYDKTFSYVEGQPVSVDNFDPDPRKVCAPGIHFFITREEAEEWQG